MADSDEVLSKLSMEELLRLEHLTKTKKKKVKSNINLSGSASGEKNGRKPHKYKPEECPLIRMKAPFMKASLDQARKFTARDPRFDKMFGSLDVDEWESNYSFIFENRRKERQLLEQELKDETDKSRAEKLKNIICRMENQERQHTKNRKARKVMAEQRERNITALKEGKKPYYMSKSKIKLAEKMSHFQDLKSSNRIDKYMQRKEKKMHIREQKR